MVRRGPLNGKKSITLRDVIVHLQHMEVRLTARIDAVEQRVSALESRVDRLERNLTTRMDNLEREFKASIEMLEGDLVAVIKDTLIIRRHVGMQIPEEE